MGLQDNKQIARFKGRISGPPLVRHKTKCSEDRGLTNSK